MRFINSFGKNSTEMEELLEAQEKYMEAINEFRNRTGLSHGEAALSDYLGDKVIPALQGAVNIARDVEAKDRKGLYYRVDEARLSIKKMGERRFQGMSVEHDSDVASESIKDHAGKFLWGRMGKHAQVLEKYCPNPRFLADQLLAYKNMCEGVKKEDGHVFEEFVEVMQEFRKLYDICWCDQEPHIRMEWVR